MAQFKVEIRVTIRKADDTIIAEETSTTQAPREVLVRMPFGQIAQETFNELERQIAAEAEG